MPTSRACSEAENHIGWVTGIPSCRSTSTDDTANSNRAGDCWERLEGGSAWRDVEDVRRRGEDEERRVTVVEVARRPALPSSVDTSILRIEPVAPVMPTTSRRTLAASRLPPAWSKPMSLPTHPTCAGVTAAEAFYMSPSSSPTRRPGTDGTRNEVIGSSPAERHGVGVASVQPGGPNQAVPAGRRSAANAKRQRLPPQGDAMANKRNHRGRRKRRRAGSPGPAAGCSRRRLGTHHWAERTAAGRRCGSSTTRSRWVWRSPRRVRIRRWCWSRRTGGCDVRVHELKWEAPVEVLLTMSRV